MLAIWYAPSAPRRRFRYPAISARSVVSNRGAQPPAPPSRRPPQRSLASTCQALLNSPCESMLCARLAPKPGQSDLDHRPGAVAEGDDRGCSAGYAGSRDGRATRRLDRLVLAEAAERDRAVEEPERVGELGDQLAARGCDRAALRAEGINRGEDWGARPWCRGEPGDVGDAAEAPGAEYGHPPSALDKAAEGRRQRRGQKVLATREQHAPAIHK